MSKKNRPELLKIKGKPSYLDLDLLIRQTQANRREYIKKTKNQKQQSMKQKLIQNKGKWVQTLDKIEQFQQNLNFTSQKLNKTDLSLVELTRDIFHVYKFPKPHQKNCGSSAMLKFDQKVSSILLNCNYSILSSQTVSTKHLNVKELPQNLNLFNQLKFIYVKFCPIQQINLDYLPSLQKIDLCKLIPYQAYNQISRIRLKNMLNLIQLNLNGNQIIKTNWLSGIPNIYKLYLSNNLIVDSDGISNLPNLQYCSLDQNKIREIRGLKNLPSLTQLIISRNSVKLQKNVLSYLPNLTIFNAYGNQISVFNTQDLINSLTRIQLHHNKISVLNELPILSQTILYLNLSYNTFKRCPAILKSLIKLRYLYLNNNFIEKIQNLENLKKLTILNLNNNYITKIQNTDSVGQLQELYLDFNKISKISNINSHHKLRILSLEGNPIKNIQAVDQLQSLECLNLDNTDIPIFTNIYNQPNRKDNIKKWRGYYCPYLEEKYYPKQYVQKKMFKGIKSFAQKPKSRPGLLQCFLQERNQQKFLQKLYSKLSMISYEELFSQDQQNNVQKVIFEPNGSEATEQQTREKVIYELSESHLILEIFNRVPVSSVWLSQTGLYEYICDYFISKWIGQAIQKKDYTSVDRQHQNQIQRFSLKVINIFEKLTGYILIFQFFKMLENLSNQTNSFQIQYVDFYGQVICRVLGVTVISDVKTITVFSNLEQIFNNQILEEYFDYQVLPLINCNHFYFDTKLLFDVNNLVNLANIDDVTILINCQHLTSFKFNSKNHNIIYEKTKVLSNLKKAFFLKQYLTKQSKVMEENQKVERWKHNKAHLNLFALGLFLMKDMKMLHYENVRALQFNILPCGSLIKTIENIESFKKLRYLYLRKNLICKIENLQGYEFLEVISLADNKIAKIQGLNHLRYLKYLQLNKNRINKIQNLQLLDNLEVLELGFNNIKQIEGLQSLQNLRQISLHHNKIKTIQNMKFNQELIDINLGYNYITKVEGLAVLKNQLEKNINLQYNLIKKLENLQQQFEGVRSLNICLNYIENFTKTKWEQLAQLKYLKITIPVQTQQQKQIGVSRQFLQQQFQHFHYLTTLGKQLNLSKVDGNHNQFGAFDQDLQELTQYLNQGDWIKFNSIKLAQITKKISQRSIKDLQNQRAQILANRYKMYMDRTDWKSFGVIIKQLIRQINENVESRTVMPLQVVNAAGKCTDKQLQEAHKIYLKIFDQQALQIIEQQQEQQRKKNNAKQNENINQKQITKE